MSHIRPGTPADAAALKEIAVEAFSPYIERIGTEPWPMRLDYTHVLASEIVWVIGRDEQPEGFVAMVNGGDHVLVETIAVVPAAQGAGLGSRLLDAAQAQAVAWGVSEIRLYTNEAMTENLTYYPRRGFTETGRAEEGGYRRVFFTKQVPVTQLP